MFINPVPEESAEGALGDYYRQQRQAWGFLPNYAAAFSTRPEVAAAWSLLNTTVREAMDRRRFEIATIGAARALGSTYCTAAHSTFLRDTCDDEAAMTAIATDPSGAALSDEDRAVYAFAAKVAVDAPSVRQDDVDALRSHGLTDADVADVVFAAAARCSSPACWTASARSSTCRPLRGSRRRSWRRWSSGARSLTAEALPALAGGLAHWSALTRHAAIEHQRRVAAAATS